MRTVINPQVRRPVWVTALPQPRLLALLTTAPVSTQEARNPLVQIPKRKKLFYPDTSQQPTPGLIAAAPPPPAPVLEPRVSFFSQFKKRKDVFDTSKSALAVYATGFQDLPSEMMLQPSPKRRLGITPGTLTHGSTPKTLLAEPAAPGNPTFPGPGILYQHRRKPVTDTTSSTPPILLDVAVIVPPTMPAMPIDPPDRPKYTPIDVYGMPTVLLGDIDPGAPIVPTLDPAPPVLRPWRAIDFIPLPPNLMPPDGTTPSPPTPGPPGGGGTFPPFPPFPPWPPFPAPIGGGGGWPSTIVIEDRPRKKKRKLTLREELDEIFQEEMELPDGVEIGTGSSDAEVDKRLKKVDDPMEGDKVSLDAADEEELQELLEMLRKMGY